MLDIVTNPNEILRKKSANIGLDFLLSEDTQTLIKKMLPTMKIKDGVGLAAPQIGKNINICVIAKEAVLGDEKTDLKLNSDLVLINPVWEKINRKKNIDTEGCLSVPKTFGEVKRYNEIIVEALNEKGVKLEFNAHNFFARVIQHEVDHLHGILFIDKAKKIFTEE